MTKYIFCLLFLLMPGCVSSSSFYKEKLDVILGSIGCEEGDYIIYGKTHYDEEYCRLLIRIAMPEDYGKVCSLIDNTGIESVVCLFRKGTTGIQKQVIITILGHEAKSSSRYPAKLALYKDGRFTTLIYVNGLVIHPPDIPRNVDYNYDLELLNDVLHGYPLCFGSIVGKQKEQLSLDTIGLPIESVKEIKHYKSKSKYKHIFRQAWRKIAFWDYLIIFNLH